MGKFIKLKKMKYSLLIAGASAISLRENKPLIHPQTGLAITTTGQHWYGQPPLAMAEEEPKKENLNIDSPDFKGPKHLFPLDPASKNHATAFPVKFDDKGYPAPEKVHILSPEVHMEYNNQPSQYKFPRTAFYAQTNSNQNKLDKINRFENTTDKSKKDDIGETHYDPWVHHFVKANVPSLPLSCRAINDMGDMPTIC